MENKHFSDMDKLQASAQAFLEIDKGIAGLVLDGEAGRKFDNEKTPYYLCPLTFIKPLVAVFALGKQRYGFLNWQKNFDTPEMTEAQRFESACLRHIEAIQEHGPLAINHDDGGVYHAAQIAWDSLRLLWGALRK